MSVIDVNVNNFEDEVINYKEKVLVDFNADWCGPCKMLKPILEEINNIKVVSVNIDSEEELAEKYNIVSIPCLVLFNNGNEIKRNVGLISKDDIENFIGGE